MVDVDEEQAQAAVAASEMRTLGNLPCSRDVSLVGSRRVTQLSITILDPCELDLRLRQL